MAKRQRARRMASQGASANKIERKTGVSSQAANKFVSRFGGSGGGSTPTPMPQQAPYPQAFINNPPPGNVQYIPGLMVRGNESLGYRPEYGGGGYAAFPEGGSASVDDLKDFYKAMAATGNKAIGLGSWDQIRAAAAGYDPSQFGGTAPSQGGGGGGPTPARMNFATAMADNKIGRREIQAMMDQRGIKGKDQDRARMRITNRLAQRGGLLGIGAAKDYVKAYAERNPSEAMAQTMTGKKYRVGSSGMTNTYGAPQNNMSTRRGQRSALFRGIQDILGTKDYARGDVLASLKSGDVRAQPFGTGGGGGKRKGKRKNKGGTTMGTTDMGTTAMDQTQPMASSVMSPEEMKDSSLSINFPGVGAELSNWATGFRSKRSSRRRAGSKAQGLASNLVNPTGSWKYGT